MYDCCIFYNYDDRQGYPKDSDQCLSEKFLDMLEEKLNDMGLKYLNFRNLLPGQNLFTAFTSDYLKKCKKYVIVLTEGLISSSKHRYFTQIGMMNKIQSGTTIDVLVLSLGVRRAQLDELGLSILEPLYFGKDESKWEGKDSEELWKQVAEFFEGDRGPKHKLCNLFKWIHIDQDSTGHSYENLFGKYFDDKNIERVTLEDPFIRNGSQLENFEDFCELVREKKMSGMCSVKVIELITVECEAKEKKEKKQEMKEKDVEKFAKIRKSLERNGITLEVNYIKDLHDRQIRVYETPTLQLQ